MAGGQRIAKPTWRQRLASWIGGPRADLERAFADNKRRRINEARAAYDGAKRSGRTQYWRRQLSDANAETFGQAATLRNVARDLVRNNSFAARAVTAIPANVVGAGIRPNVKAKSKTAKRRLDDLVRRHLLTTDIDADGRHNIFGIQRLCMRTVVESGEVLVRRRRRRSSDGYALPFQLQVLEPDFIDTMKDGETANGNVIVQGVEFDLRGARVAYYLHKVHPGALMGIASLESQRVPAADVVHMYRVDRPGQVRGVTWFAPVLLKLHDYQDYADAQLLRQKIAACFAAFITTDADEAAEMDADGNPVGTSDLGHDYQSLEPGLIQHLDVGEDVKFADPPKVDGFDSYTGTTLREIAVGLGMPYTVLTGDLKGVNFSSGRMGWLEFQRNINEWCANVMAPTLLAGVERWFLEGAALTGGPAVAGASIDWIPPRREMINPKEEIAASKELVRCGFSSRTRESQRFGVDPEDLEREIAEENKRADQLELRFDSDPRVMSAQGQEQASAGVAGDDETADDEGTENA